jgi:radical SAM superfamily enzyme YgiQ (UPF0313 family)
LWPPVDLVCISGLLAEAGYQLCFKDFQVDGKESLESFIAGKEFDVVIAGYSPNLEEEDLALLSEVCRARPGATIILLASHLDRLEPQHAERLLERYEWVAALVMDFAWNDLAEYIEGVRDDSICNVIFRQNGELVCVLKPQPPRIDLPVPRHELFKSEAYYHYDGRGGYLTATLAGFGCNQSCRFCWGPHLYPHVSVRSVESVIAELEHVVACGIQELYFTDLLFAHDRSHLIELCSRIVEKGIALRWYCSSRFDLMTPEVIHAMASAGCRCIEFGLESGNYEIRKQYGKDVSDETVASVLAECRKQDVHSAVFLILGLPEETLVDMNRSLEIVEKMQPDFLSLNVLWADPLADMGGAVGLDSGADRSGYSTRINFRHPHVTNEEISNLYRKAMRRFYFRRRSIVHQLHGLGSWRRIRQLTRTLFGLIRSRAL